METLLHNRDLLDPVHHGPFAWKLLSHKLARWLVPPAAIVAVVGLVILAPHQLWAMMALWVAAVVAVLAVVASRWPESRPLRGSLPSRLLGVLAANVAVLHAWWRVIHGHEDHVWEPTRR